MTQETNLNKILSSKTENSIQIKQRKKVIKENVLLLSEDKDLDLDLSYMD